MNTEVPDLQSQLEDLLHAVWRGEQQWRTEARIDLAARLGSHHEPRTRVNRPLCG